MPLPNDPEFYATLQAIAQAITVRRMCYGDEHRPVTRMGLEHAVSLTALADQCDELMETPDSPWDLHLIHAAIHTALTDSPEDAYAHAALVASICITMMLDLHPQL